MSQRNSLERIASYQYPTGHLNHLSAEHVQLLAEFKALCQKAGYWIPAGDATRASHDDETLLRYLRARKFAPKDAYDQFKTTEDWRKEQQIDNLYSTIDVDEYDESRRLYPQWTGRRDKRGIPVYVFEVAGLDSKKMTQYEAAAGKVQGAGRLPPKLLRLFALYENLTSFVLPLCSVIPTRPHPETPVSQSNNLVDISRVGLRQFWNLKNHMQDASTLATAHYPETLDRIFIIGAPSFFPTVWNWIKRWFDPITVSKIFILSAADVKPTLEKFIDIDDIPKRYGGNLDWEWGQLPNLDDEISKLLGMGAGQSVPTGPIKWVETADGAKVEAHAVGTKSGKQRDDVIARISREDIMKSLNSFSAHQYKTDASQEQPAAVAEDSATLAAAMSNSQNRLGTSESKYTAQSHTLADGQLAHGTPETRDHGYGDKTTIMEPGTVGQAAKDVTVPQQDPPREPTYLENAQNALGSATSAVTQAGSAITAAGANALHATGLTGQKAADEAEKQEANKKPEDSRVDELGEEHVEDFVRSQYTSNNRVGDRKIDKLGRGDAGN